MNLCMTDLARPSEELLAAIRQSYAKDPWFQDQNNLVHVTIEDGLYRNQNGQILVPCDENARKLCMSLHHDPPYLGHLGRDWTLEQIKRSFYWPKMRQDIADFVGSCDQCQRNKAANAKPSGLLQPLQVPEGLWDSVSMDLITCLPETEKGNTAIVVFVDRLSKMVRLAAVKTSITAEQYAELFVKEIFAKHGLPASIVSDRDPRFDSEFFRQLCKLLGVKQCMSTTAHPQSDGQTERMNRVLEEMLRAFVSVDQRGWDLHLPCCEFAINNAFNESIRTTPFFLNYGFHPRHPTNFALPSGPRPGERFVSSLQEALSEAQRCMRVAQERQARYANKGRKECEFEVGTYVLLDSKNLRLSKQNRDLAKKLRHRFVGPFKILKRVTPVAYELETSKEMQMHDV